jgi:hypothetical protein
MAYVIDGNLYFQAGSRSPQQLTHNPTTYPQVLFFSEDGEKIFFSQGRLREIYAIHVDGSQLQALVTESFLLTLGPEYSEEPTTFCEPVLVPHSALVLFRTCSHPNNYTTEYQSDLFVVDTDTGEISTLFHRREGGSYYVSPDGKMLAVDRVNSVDVIGIDGRMIRRSLATYTLSEPIPLGALVYWLADSSGLILGLPINTFYDTSPPPLYEIWRYSLATGKGVKIKLDPSPMGIEPVRVSPDGNWITYTNYDERPFYLGDLRAGRAQPYESAEISNWSPDSTYFVYASYEPERNGLYLASVNAPPILIEKSSEFVRWLDAKRYIYFESADNTAPAYVLGEIGKEPLTVLAGNLWPLRCCANIIFHYEPPSE